MRIELIGDDAVQLVFDGEEAKGTVLLEAGSYGPTLKVNGRVVGIVDLCPCVDGEPAQIIIDNQRFPDDEPLAKIVLAPDDTVVVVNRDATRLPYGHKQAIHSEGDRVFGGWGE